jgi:hypothetical protein
MFNIVGFELQTAQSLRFLPFLMVMKEHCSESYMSKRSSMELPIPVKTFSTSIACKVPINPGTGPKTPLSLQLLFPSIVLTFGYKHL